MNTLIFHEKINDLVDRIAIGETGDAVGNIASAERSGFDLTATIGGEGIGVEGVQLDLKVSLSKSSLQDPIQNFDRRLNNEIIEDYVFEMRHDIAGTRLAYGGLVSWQDRAPTFRSQTIDDVAQGVTSEFYVERKELFGITARLGLYNITNQRFNLTRRIFDARRDIGQLLRTERRIRDSAPFVRLDLNGSF